MASDEDGDRIRTDGPADREAVGECARCTAVVRYDPEAQGPATALVCRGCGLAALGRDWS